MIYLKKYKLSGKMVYCLIIMMIDKTLNKLQLLDFVMSVTTKQNLFITHLLKLINLRSKCN